MINRRQPLVDFAPEMPSSGVAHMGIGDPIYDGASSSSPISVTASV